MTEISNVQAEVTPLDVEVTASNSAEIATVEDGLDVTITKKEYKIVGDEVYIAKLYDDAPQWMKDLVQLVVDNTMETESAMLRNDLIKQLNQFATSYVPLNTYTQSILDLSNADTAMHATLETLNSNFNDGLDTANSQIINLQSTKASKTEVATKVIETLTAQLATPTSELGATIGNLQQAIVDGDSANADSVTTLMSVLEGEVDARASAIETINTYVGIDEAGASTNTGLSAYLAGSDGTIGGADSQLANSIRITAEGIESKFAYNSTVNIGGVYKKSGFGLTSNYSGGTGTVGDPYSSEFWIDATKLKFTNSNATGSTAPFTIDASGATPQITFNGKVSFSNVTGSESLALKDMSNVTTIDGGKITTGTVNADRLGVNSALIGRLNVTGGLVANNLRVPGVNGGADLLSASGSQVVISNLKVLGTASMPGITKVGNSNYFSGVMPSSGTTVLAASYNVYKPFACTYWGLVVTTNVTNITSTGSSKDLSVTVYVDGSNIGSGTSSGPYSNNTTVIGGYGNTSGESVNVTIHVSGNQTSGSYSGQFTYVSVVEQ